MAHAIYPSITHAPAPQPPKPTLAHAVASHSKAAATVAVDPSVHPAVAHAVTAHVEAAKAEAVAVHPVVKAAAAEAKAHAGAAANTHVAGKPAEAKAHADAAAAAATKAHKAAVHPAARAAASKAAVHAKAAAKAADTEAETPHEAAHPHPTAKKPAHEGEVRQHSMIAFWMGVAAIVVVVIIMMLSAKQDITGTGSESEGPKKLLAFAELLGAAALFTAMGLTLNMAQYMSTSRKCFVVNAKERAIISSFAYGFGGIVAGVGALMAFDAASNSKELSSRWLTAGMFGVTVAAAIGGAGSFITMGAAEDATLGTSMGIFGNVGRAITDAA